MQRADVGMVQGRDGARLAFEALGELLGRNLDGHIPSETRISSEVDDPHSAGTDLGGDFIRTDSGPGGKWQAFQF